MNNYPHNSWVENYVDNLVSHTCNVAHKCNMGKKKKNYDTQIGIILK